MPSKQISAVRSIEQLRFWWSRRSCRGHSICKVPPFEP